MAESDHRKYYRTHKWAVTRSLIRQRDDWRCVKCGSRYKVEVNHIVSVLDGGDMWDPKNLQTLCKTCHQRHTKQQWLERDPTKRRHRGRTKIKDKRVQEWADFADQLRKT